MKKWEYYTNTLELKKTFWGGSEFPNLEIETVCNKLGLEGWELVSCQTNNSSQGQSTRLLLIFKREI